MPTQDPDQPGDGLVPGLPEQYEVEAELGRGGMGTVYRAHDVKHGRTVAIKVLRPEIAHAFGADRFLREIRTVAPLVHPHIVSIFDSGSAQGTLFFVMPYIEGESLRQRLDREGSLPIATAIRIAREVSSALQYAHDHGIVHRDIKPENILLSRNGQAWLADFGVARAAAQASQRITSTGLILGSPLYLSPEQTRDDKQVDHRADIYSLGCVLYEMLVGKPVFEASHVQAVLLKHMTEPAPSVSARRPEVPAGLDAVLNRALAKLPADRFQSARELEDALERSLTSPPAITAPVPPRSRAREYAWKAGVGLIGAVGSVILALSTDWIKASIPTSFPDVPSWGREQLDTTRYVVLPLNVGPGVPALDAENRLGDALGAWEGIDVVDRSQVLAFEKAAGISGGANNPQRYTRELRAGRFISGEIALKGDSLRVYMELGDGGRPDVKINKFRRTYPMNVQTMDMLFKDVADSLMLRGLAPQCIGGGPGTTYLAAIRSCDHGFSALEDGQLAIADSMFVRALQADPSYARAALWLAQTRLWLSSPPSVEGLIRLASSSSSELTPREAALAGAYRQLLARDFNGACSTFGELTRADSLDYAAWLGIGECHRNDRSVVRDPSSPSGWSFRSSMHLATTGYRRAFEVKPGLIGAYRESSFARIRDILFTSASSYREGLAVSPDTGTFRAYPDWVADTLSFTPVRTSVFSRGGELARPKGLETALDHQRDVMKDLSTNWARSFPNNAFAHEGIAVALELSGDASAITAIRRARGQAHSRLDQIRLARSEVLLRVKFGLPSKVGELRIAKSLADSLLNLKGLNQTESALLTPMAVLVGKPALAALHARAGALAYGQRVGVPTGVAEPSRALMVFAAMSGPRDSISKLETETETAISNALPPANHAQARRDLMARAILMSYPTVTLEALKGMLDMGPSFDLIRAAINSDSTQVAALLRQIDSNRAGPRARDVTIDVAYVESNIQAMFGDVKGAEARIDPLLRSIQWYPPGRLEDFVHLAAAMRALVLRADLAILGGNTALAKHWSQPVAILWSSSEGSLRPTTRRMLRYVEQEK